MFLAQFVASLGSQNPLISGVGTLNTICALRHNHWKVRLQVYKSFIGFDPPFLKEAVHSAALHFDLSLLYPTAADEHSVHCWLKECEGKCLKAKCIDSQYKNKMHDKKALKFFFSSSKGCTQREGFRSVIRKRNSW